MPTPDYSGAYRMLFPRKMSTNSFLTIYILHLLAKKGERMYGKEIIDKIEERFNSMLKPSHGLVYPILHKLEQEGLVQSITTSKNLQKPRRYYRITEKGREVLETEANRFKPALFEAYTVLASAIQDLYLQDEK